MSEIPGVMLTDEEVAALEVLLAMVEAAPWGSGLAAVIGDTGGRLRVLADCSQTEAPEADFARARFIARSHNLLPQLLAERKNFLGLLGDMAADGHLAHYRRGVAEGARLAAEKAGHVPYSGSAAPGEARAAIRASVGTQREIIRELDSFAARLRAEADAPPSE